MNKTLLTLLITAMLFILSSAGVSAAVDLPWETTYDCNAWNQYSDALSCDGLSKGGNWQCSGGEWEQITSAANNPGGGGGKGQRHWIGDGQNSNSGGMQIGFNNIQPEFWLRWYMKFPSGFTWDHVAYQKAMYIEVGQTQAFYAGWYSGDSYQLRVYADSRQVLPCTNCGWSTVMGGATGDGLWHCYEVHVKMDTNGSNGVGEVWIDEVKILSFSDIDFGTQSGWNFILIASNQHEPQNGQCLPVDFDDMAISNTGYIGPISPTCPNGVCDPGETCLADSCCNGVTYNTATQVCCSGVIYAGDCCVDGDCTSPDACINHQCTSQTADLNQDGSVNSIDFGIMMSYWGYTSYPPADINQDGLVNTVDFGIMMSQWG